MDKTKIYLANGLFSLADRNLNDLIARVIRSTFNDIDLFVPQEQSINDKSGYADSLTIYELDSDNLMKSHIMVAVIDGVEIDSGVACEIGVASVLGIPVIALYSDVRQLGADNSKKIDALIENSVENQFMYRNLFVVGAIRNSGGVIVKDLDELKEQIKITLRKRKDWS